MFTGGSSLNAPVHEPLANSATLAESPRNTPTDAGDAPTPPPDGATSSSHSTDDAGPDCADHNNQHPNQAADTTTSNIRLAHANENAANKRRAEDNPATSSSKKQKRADAAAKPTNSNTTRYVLSPIMLFTLTTITGIYVCATGTRPNPGDKVS